MHIEKIFRLHFTKFKGDRSHLKNSFLNTRTIISLNSQEVENFFTRREPEEKNNNLEIKEEQSKKDKINIISSLQRFLDLSKCSSLSKIKLKNFKTKF